jgi:ABC-type transporter Mla subunit MlaD
MRRLVVIPVLLVAIAGALLATGAGEGSDALKTYEIELDNAFGLVEGGDLKIGGVKAGQTTGFEITRKQPYRTIVTAEITEPGFDSLRTDGRCDVRQQSLIGEYFIDCDLGTARKELPDGGRVPVERTSSTIPPDLINTVMRRPQRERFRLILNELGTGLAGRPEELNRVIRRAHPALRELSQTLTILRNQNRVIRDFIRDADTVSAAVEPQKEALAKWAREAADTAGIQGSRSEELGRYWNRVPDFLAELEPTMAQLEATADEQIPALRSLERAAPKLQRFLTTAEPFARETRGALPSLGRAAEAGKSALDESKQEVAELRRLAAFAPQLGKPLRQFLQTIDDRKRSIEKDPQAAGRAPPAPDKTAYTAGRGYTGMEAFWNYVYFQTLGINAFDEVGHVLRIILFNTGPCPPYEAAPTKDEIRDCNSWLGPNQPGVTTPEPKPASTREAEPGERKPRRTAADAAPAAPQRGEGGAEKPKSGLGAPPIKVPDQVKELLDKLGKSLPKETPLPLDGTEQGTNTDQLLDYLLAP